MALSGPLQVVIFEDREQGKPCNESCGVDWLKEENQELAQQLIARNFGDGVQLRFVNLAEPGAEQQHSAMIARIVGEQLLLPALVINGEVKISGYFDLRMLRDMIEVAQEVG